jgi:hypothetical protein
VCEEKEKNISENDPLSKEMAVLGNTYTNIKRIKHLREKNPSRHLRISLLGAGEAKTRWHRLLRKVCTLATLCDFTHGNVGRGLGL